jgi:hypothetical protein
MTYEENLEKEKDCPWRCTCGLPGRMRLGMTWICEDCIKKELQRRGMIP